MVISELENWSLEDEHSTGYVWKHKNRELYMKVSYQPDHYKDGEQIMKWRARATIGRNITFGQYHYVLCGDDTSREEAKDEAVEWAIDWMKNFRLEKYDIEETLIELESSDRY